MTINEAPYLTNRVVALLMFVVFALCLCADRLQCQNNGWQSMCIGKLPYKCSDELCRSSVITPTSLSFSSSCADKGDAVVLIAVVEVGPSVVSRRGKTISEYMADELRKQMDTGDFQRAVRQSVVGHHRILDDEEGDARTSLTEMFCTKETLRAILDIPRGQTRYVAVSDAVPLPMVDETGDFSYSTWEEAVDAALPVSRTDDPSQLPRYFPNLYAKLASFSNERAASTASSSSKRCDALVVVVCTVAHQLASVRSVWQTPWNAGKQLSIGHDYLRGAVTRYLMTCKKSLSPANATASSASPQLCKQACQIYGLIEPGLISSDHSLSNNFVGDRGISATAKHNCYYEVLSALGEGSVNGRFSAYTLSRVFDDCLRLSPDGARAYAVCLLRG